MGEGETTPLVQMEKAAETSSDPQQIKEARTIRRHPASHADKLWIITLGMVLGLLLGARVVTLDARLRRGADGLGIVIAPHEL